MAEEWLRKIVNRIKDEDRGVAERDAYEICKESVLLQSSPAFWRSFCDVLEGLIKDMQEMFGNDVTRADITIIRTSTAHHSLDIKKSAYPYVTFRGTPRFDGKTVQLSYAVKNPRQDKDGEGRPINVLPTSISSRFDLDEGAAVLHLNGHALKRQSMPQSSSSKAIHPTPKAT